MNDLEIPGHFLWEIPGHFLWEIPGQFSGAVNLIKSLVKTQKDKNIPCMRLVNVICLKGDSTNLGLR